jgi:hypothetical protein
MRIINKIILVAALAAPAAAMTGDSVQLVEGRWEERITVTRVTVGGEDLPLESFPGRITTKFTCISPEQARDPRLYFQIPDNDGDCSVPEGVVLGGRMEMSSTCKMDDGTPMKMAVQGNYGRGTYRADVIGDADMQGQPFWLNMTMEGRFVGACTGDEDKPDIALARTSSRG